MMKTLSLHMQANNENKSIRCTFCEISIEFYSTSTEAHFEKNIIINNYFYYYDIALRDLISAKCNRTKRNLAKRDEIFPIIIIHQKQSSSHY
jgi:hypothetical protein